MSTPAVPARRRGHSLLPDLADLFSGFPSFAGMRSNADGWLMRVEDDMKDGRYEVRAEIPGVDPASDIDITVGDGQLTIRAERSEKSEGNGRSEFNYGSFTRTVTLPVGADEDDIKATYDKGILSVSVGVKEPARSEKHIAITSKT